MLIDCSLYVEEKMANEDLFFFLKWIEKWKKQLLKVIKDKKDGK